MIKVWVLVIFFAGSGGTTTIDNIPNVEECLRVQKEVKMLSPVLQRSRCIERLIYED